MHAGNAFNEEYQAEKKQQRQAEADKVQIGADLHLSRPHLTATMMYVQRKAEWEERQKAREGRRAASPTKDEPKRRRFGFLHVIAFIAQL